MVHNDSTTPAQRRKSVLHCPDCGYRSEAENGWLQYTLPDSRQTRCPVCFEEISRRPTEEAPNSGELYSAQILSGIVAWNTGLRQWSESMKAFTSR